MKVEGGMGKPPANNQKRLQRMERDLVKNRDYMERKDRERDAARTDVQSTDNQAVISASKPKAKKAREAEAVKQAKAAKQIDKAADKAKAAADKAEATQAKMAKKEKDQLEKKARQLEKKKKKEKKSGELMSGTKMERVEVRMSGKQQWTQTPKKLHSPGRNGW